MKSFCESLKFTNMAVKNISAKVNAIEQSIPSFQLLLDDVGLLCSSAVAFETNAAELPSCVEDLESGSRYSNLIFYGFADGEAKSWAISERRILDVRAECLYITVAPSEIERAHCLGQFLPAKKRTIIIQFFSYTLKERILGTPVVLRAAVSL